MTLEPNFYSIARKEKIHQPNKLAYDLILCLHLYKLQDTQHSSEKPCSNLATKKNYRIMSIKVVLGPLLLLWKGRPIHKTNHKNEQPVVPKTRLSELIKKEIDAWNIY